jgi:PIN domain nuclease of toxin-antitoxin system
VTGALADTHALLWWLADDPRLSDRARGVIAAGDLPVHFSAASVWETEIKATAGKLVLTDDLLEALEADRFVELPVTARHAREAARLPLLHRDPFDRMIAAQARVEGLTVITGDHRIAEYGALVLW